MPIRARPFNTPQMWSPFSGGGMQIKQIRQQGDFVATDGKLIVGPFKTLGDLLVYMSTRDGVPPSFSADRAEKLTIVPLPPRDAPKQPAANEPLQLCPFTRLPVQIRLVNPDQPEGRWGVYGDRWIALGFQTAKHAQYWFSTRRGTTPLFDVTTVQKAKESEEPDNPLEGVNIAELTSTLNAAT